MPFIFLSWNWILPNHLFCYDLSTTYICMVKLVRSSFTVYWSSITSPPYSNKVHFVHGLKFEIAVISIGKVHFIWIVSYRQPKYTREEKKKKFRGKTWYIEMLIKQYRKIMRHPSIVIMYHEYLFISLQCNIQKSISKLKTLCTFLKTIIAEKYETV